MNGLPRDALRPPERGTERLLAPVPGAPYEPDTLKRLSEALRDALLCSVMWTCSGELPRDRLSPTPIRLHSG